VIVTLSAKGFSVIEEAVVNHLSAEAELMENLDEAEKIQLAGLLKKLLQTQED